MTPEILSKLKDYFGTQPIEKVWLFGSMSRHEETPSSDIDLIVEFVKGAKIGMRYFKIIDEPQRLCSRNIDMAEYDTIDSNILDNIDNDKILIYERL